MHDIFLSYSSKDRARLVPLVNALEAQGWTVFWDHRSIKVAQEWHQVIGTAIQQCPCVIVAWSTNAVASKWVTEEALIARDRGVLYPILIDPVMMPFGFNLIQAANFTAWDGQVDHPEFVELKEQLSIRLGLKRVPPSPPPQDDKPPAQPLPLKTAGMPTAGFSGLKWLGGLGLLAAIGVGGYQFLPSTDTEPVEPEPILITAAPPPVVEKPAPVVPEPAKPKPPQLDHLPEMVPIPKGSFMMGCDDKQESDCQNDEKKSHKVNIKPFLLAKTEVTVAQYLACVEAGKCPEPEWREKGSDYNIKTGKDDHYKQMGDALTNPNQPVVGVSWNDAQAYVQWLSGETGKKWRLPSEAEWEYAARAGTKTTYAWGEEADKGCQFTNMADQKAKTVYSAWATANCDDGYVHTSPVGNFAVNLFGLHDMYGNVWEWVEDEWHGDYSGAPDDGRAWVSGDSSDRVLRGGSWRNTPQSLRSADRNLSSPVNRFNLIGFRPAQDYGQQSK